MTYFSDTPKLKHARENKGGKHFTNQDAFLFLEMARALFYGIGLRQALLLGRAAEAFCVQ